MQDRHLGATLNTRFDVEHLFEFRRTSSSVANRVGAAFVLRSGALRENAVADDLRDSLWGKVKFLAVTPI